MAEYLLISCSNLFQADELKRESELDEKPSWWCNSISQNFVQELQSQKKKEKRKRSFGQVLIGLKIFSGQPIRKGIKVLLNDHTRDDKAALKSLSTVI